MNRKYQDRLDDETFLLGFFKRRSALKELANASDPEAAAVLVDAVDRKSPSAAGALSALKSRVDQAWTDKLWEVWAQKRQPWLGALLEKRGLPHGNITSPAGALSRLKLGCAGLSFNPATFELVAKHIHDADANVLAGVRKYILEIPDSERPAWTERMLLLKEYETIGRDRRAAESVVPFLNSTKREVQNSARAFCSSWLEPSLRALAVLLNGRESALPLERSTALDVAAFIDDLNPAVAAQAKAYQERIFQAQPDFIVEFCFKTGQAGRIRANRGTVMEALRLMEEKDASLTKAIENWISALPDDVQFNDAITDEWLRTNNGFLFGLLRKQLRLPSDGGKETLLRLLWEDVAGYRALNDSDGRLLAAALAIVDEDRRAKIIQAIQNSRDAALAEQLRRASMRVQGMDAGLGLKALLASGDEDRIVNAAREMKGSELFDLIRRWIENGRRPKDPRKRAAVEKAVAALKNLPKINVEDAGPLPSGTADLFDFWKNEKPSGDELRQNLQASDPLQRTRSLYLSFEQGIIDASVLQAKAGSEDWPERMAAAIYGANPNAASDHVYWVSACAGEDSKSRNALVACGPDEFDRAAARLKTLRGSTGSLAKRSAAELEALQSFRALEKTGITVYEDDSATQIGSTEDRGEVSADIFKN
jgi:hypothetical protein